MTEPTDGDKQIKVTDKRMFTADGELREEFKNIGSGDRPADKDEATKATVDTAAGPGPSAPGPSPGGQPAREPIVAPGGRRPESADASRGRPAEPKDYPSGARFEELVALLAQTTATFLKQATRPDVRSESLEQAQLYFDLLEILGDKTAGNLSSREQAMLDDALRQLRMALAQHG